MPFLFAYVCDLLEKLEEPFLREVGFLPGTLREYLRKHTSHWFTRHCTRLDAFATDDKAVLSMLRPHLQIDRVYGLDPANLELVVARALSLSRLHYLELQKWRTDPLNRDLAFFVHQVMKSSKATPLGARSNKVMVEDIDQVLLQIASYNTNSSPEVRSLAETWPDADHVSLLGDLYQSLQPREAKWLTRLILKNHGPLRFPNDLELSASSGHSHLPQCLQVSIKLHDGTPGAIRRSGAMMVKGHTPIQTSPSRIETTSQTNRHLEGVMNQIDFTPPASSVALPACRPPDKRTKTISSTSRAFPPTPPTSSPLRPSHGLQRASSFIIYSAAPPELSSASTGARSFPVAPTSVSPTTSLKNITRPPRLPLVPSETIERVSNDTTPTESQLTSRPVLGELSSNKNSNSQRASQSGDLVHNGASSFVCGTGKCQLTTAHCPLKYCIFILSPCIASAHYITDSLLGWHGAPYLTSLSAINHPSVPRRCAETGKRYRRIVLVESNATKPTAKFLKEIGKLGLKREGKKEWLRVYDWRLLESVGKADQGRELSHDPWVRTFIGRI